MAAEKTAPVIIERKKVISGDGHHGGAWKVAYADFVTAMMAFFMLMWLLNATTEKQRKGIADYFNPTIPVNRISGGGEGMFGGTNIFSDELLARSGTGGIRAGDEKTTVPYKAETEELEAASQKLLGASGVGNTPGQFRVDVTEEGLIVDIYDVDGAPVFEERTAELTEVRHSHLQYLMDVFADFPNNVSITGHTKSEPVVVRHKIAWTLSTERAHAARIALVDLGLPKDRMREVGGRADRSPMQMPASATANNRLRILLHRSEFKSH